MCRHWCLGSRNSSKHNGNDFIFVTSVFLAADSKVKWWCWRSTSTQSLNTKPTSVQTRETYMPIMFFRELTWGRTHHLSPIIMQYKPEMVSRERTAAEACAKLLLLGCADGWSQITKSSSPLSTGLIASVQNASLLVELSQTTEMPTIRYLLI